MLNKIIKKSEHRNKKADSSPYETAQGSEKCNVQSRRDLHVFKKFILKPE